MLRERFAVDFEAVRRARSDSTIMVKLTMDWIRFCIDHATVRSKVRWESVPFPRIGIDEDVFANGCSYFSMAYGLEGTTIETIWYTSLITQYLGSFSGFPRKGLTL